MNKHLRTLLVFVAAGVAVWLILGGKVPSVAIGPSTPPLIVLLYESQHGNLPPYAMGAANELTAAGRQVRPVDDDVVTGLGDAPTWLKPALSPGRAIMGGTNDSQQIDDALILLDGGRVLKAVKLPASREGILEAVR